MTTEYVADKHMPFLSIQAYIYGKLSLFVRQEYKLVVFARVKIYNAAILEYCVHREAQLEGRLGLSESLEFLCSCRAELSLSVRGWAQWRFVMLGNQDWATVSLMFTVVA